MLGRLDAARILRRSRAGVGGRRATRSSTTCSRPPILAWRARHEAERALERERAAARRRHRRIAAVAAAALVAFAATLALAAWALSQRSEAREKAVAAEAGERLARARQLQASALLALGSDPERGVALALEAVRLAPSASTDDVLRRAMRESRVRTVARLGAPVTDLSALPDGTLAAVTERGGIQLVDGGKPGRVVVAPQRGAQSWLSGPQRAHAARHAADGAPAPGREVVATSLCPPARVTWPPARACDASSSRGAGRRA